MHALTTIPIWVWPVAIVALWGLIVLGRVSLRAWQATRWKRRPPIVLKHPVVLVHGIFGFHKMGRWGLEQSYFRGIGYYLELLGVDAHYPSLPMADSIAVRAEHLTRFINSLNSDRIILIAHSMGGLDARYAIRHLGLGERVACLVTIGTPHRGTPIAEFGAHPVLRIVRWFLERIGLRTAAIDAMTVAAMTRFNVDYLPEESSVETFSVVAAASWLTMVFNPALWLSYAFSRWRAGPSDGLVPAESQRWGRVLFEIDADHWAQIGWSWRYDARGLYERVLRELGRLGY